MYTLPRYLISGKYMYVCVPRRCFCGERHVMLVEYMYLCTACTDALMSELVNERASATITNSGWGRQKLYKNL